MRVFVSGGTGYMGKALIPRLLDDGYEVDALARHGSETKLPAGCSPVIGNALDASTFVVPSGCVYVHMVGVAHPGPWKARQFHDIDQTALEASVVAASAARVNHFVYVSVAQPAPAMHEYQRVRAHCEKAIADAGLNANVVRPWYVLGPGHRWPYVLLPVYKALEMLPPTRDGALRLGLVSLREMTATLAWSVANPPTGVRIIDVPMIRRIGSSSGHARAGVA